MIQNKQFRFVKFGAIRWIDYPDDKVVDTGLCYRIYDKQ